MDNKVRSIMRGHLISIDVEPIILKKFGDEFYKTRDWNLILGKTFVSFRQGKRIHRFNFSDIGKFYLKDSCIFVIIPSKTKKRFYFKIV